VELLLFERVDGNFLLGWTGFGMIERVIGGCVFSLLRHTYGDEHVV